MHVGCFHARDSWWGEDGRGRTLCLLSELLHSGTEEPCLLGGREQQEPAQTHGSPSSETTGAAEPHPAAGLAPGDKDAAGTSSSAG